MTRRDAIVVLAALAITAACSSGQEASPSAPSSPEPAAVAQPVELTVYAAASLKDVFAEVEIAYEAAVPGAQLTIATDSSSTLRTQIEEGAPADVFLSADQKNPQTLVDAGLADGEAVDFAGNLLTIVVPSDNPAGIESPKDLAGPGIKIVAAGDEGPITRYAQEAVTNLAAQPGYPAGFVEAYTANIVSREENVKAVVGKIELGEGDAAIVYVTDATASSGLKVIEIPASANVAATYAGVVVGRSTHRNEGHAFLEWLVGPAGAEILATFGFLPPS